jgi:hypothetical protein
MRRQAIYQIIILAVMLGFASSAFAVKLDPKVGANPQDLIIDPKVQPKVGTKYEEYLKELLKDKDPVVPDPGPEVVVPTKDDPAKICADGKTASAHPGGICCPEKTEVKTDFFGVLHCSEVEDDESDTDGDIPSCSAVQAIVTINGKNICCKDGEFFNFSTQACEVNKVSIPKDTAPDNNETPAPDIEPLTDEQRLNTGSGCSLMRKP